MTILFLNKLNKRWEDKFKSLQEEFPEVSFIKLEDTQDKQNALRVADAVVCGRLSEEDISAAGRLKAVFIPFTGLNTFPLKTIRQKGIVISNTHANAKYVAERAVALTLSLLGRVAEFHNDLKEGKWNRTSEESDMWETLHGRQVGIIGLGHIGINIARLLEPFGCTVYGFRRNNTNPDKKLIRETGNLLYVIEKSEVIFVCLPLNPETKNLLYPQILSKMKGKYIINVGRGETISEEGLYNALKDGILKGAALDVWYNYPGKKTEPVYPANKPFWELPNVLLSPHKSSSNVKAVNAMVDDTYENIRSYIISGVPKHTVKL